MTEEELSLYELAFLFKMPVVCLINTMPFAEYVNWVEYLKLRPPGWQDDQRAAHIMHASGAKFKDTEVFPSLAAIRQSGRIGTVEGTLKQSAMFKFMQGATGGDRPAFMDEL